VSGGPEGDAARETVGAYTLLFNNLPRGIPIGALQVAAPPALGSAPGGSVKPVLGYRRWPGRRLLSINFAGLCTVHPLRAYIMPLSPPPQGRVDPSRQFGIDYVTLPDSRLSLLLSPRGESAETCAECSADLEWFSGSGVVPCTVL
jgi:hypothetical protein